MRSKHIIMFIIFIAGFWGGNVLYTNYFANNDAAAISSLTNELKKAPDFTLPDLSGVKHNIHEWDGNVIVLNFWATWCPPCRKETPLFVELQETYGSQGLQFVGIAIDTRDQVQDFMDTYGVNYPMLIGADDAIKVSESFGNRLGGLPYTVVIDRTGTINYIRQGEVTREIAEKNIKVLL